MINNTIAITGQMSVCKTTLFNQLIKNSGTILDKNFDSVVASCLWQHQEYFVIDISESGVKVAKDSDVALLVVGGNSITKRDELIIRGLRAVDVPITLVVHKNHVTQTMIDAAKAFELDDVIVVDFDSASASEVVMNHVTGVSASGDLFDPFSTVSEPYEFTASAFDPFEMPSLEEEPVVEVIKDEPVVEIDEEEPVVEVVKEEPVVEIDEEEPVSESSEEALEPLEEETAEAFVEVSSEPVILVEDATAIELEPFIALDVETPTYEELPLDVHIEPFVTTQALQDPFASFDEPVASEEEVSEPIITQEEPAPTEVSQDDVETPTEVVKPEDFPLNELIVQSKILQDKLDGLKLDLEKTNKYMRHTSIVLDAIIGIILLCFIIVMAYIIRLMFF